MARQRVSGTVIGVAVGIGVNSFRLPTRKRKDILFVSGIDHTLIEKDETLSDYSRRQLNYLISAGANFTRRRHMRDTLTSKSITKMPAARICLST